MEKNTKTRILDVAQDLIQRYGVNGMSYKDIGEAVGIRKASVHTHFSKKDDLLRALLTRYNDDALRMIDAVIASDDTPENKLRRYYEVYEILDGGDDKACLYGMVSAEIASLNESLREQVSSFYRENELRLVDILEQGRASGDFAFKGDTAITASLIFTALQGGLILTRAEGGTQQYNAIFEQLLQLVKA